MYKLQHLIIQIDKQYKLPSFRLTCASTKLKTYYKIIINSSIKPKQNSTQLI